MKFVIETKVLTEALEKVSVGCSGHNFVAILSNVRIEAGGKGISLSTSNMHLHLTTTVQGMIVKKGDTTVPLALLSALVRQITTHKITFTQNEQFLDLVAGEVKARFETLPASEFPQPPDGEWEERTCDIQKEVVVPFEMLSHAMGIQAHAFRLQGIYLDPKEDGLMYLVATDGRRMATFMEKSLCSHPVIVSNLFVAALLKLKPSGEFTLGICGGKIRVSSPDLELFGELIEADYPIWDRLIPKQSSRAISCGRKELIRALQMCRVFAGGNDPVAELTGDGKEVEVAHPGKLKDRLLGTELEKQGDIKVKINAQFMVDCLSVLEGESVRIQQEGPRDYLLIEEGKYREIVAPMLIGG